MVERSALSRGCAGCVVMMCKPALRLVYGSVQFLFEGDTLTGIFLLRRNSSCMWDNYINVTAKISTTKWK